MTEQEVPINDPSRRRLLRYLVLGGLGGGILLTAVADEEVRRAFNYDNIPQIE